MRQNTHQGLYFLTSWLIIKLQQFWEKTPASANLILMYCYYLQKKSFSTILLLYYFSFWVKYCQLFHVMIKYETFFFLTLFKCSFYFEGQIPSLEICNCFTWYFLTNPNLICIWPFYSVTIMPAGSPQQQYVFLHVSSKQDPQVVLKPGPLLSLM